mmetsp:Transcript_3725/g.3156  ORF Transcript_3725/g.3156 Transcript_3725/m.3156 type:complete len:196 (-) Transcript_3725:1254-1841(-)
MSKSLDNKLNELMQLLISVQQKNLIPIELHNGLLSRVNTLSFVLNESKTEQLAPSYSNKLHGILDELKTVLSSIDNDGASIFQKFRNLLPGSNVKKLELLIPKLLEISDRLVLSASVQKYSDSQESTKRKAEHLIEDDISDDEKGFSQGYKKVHNGSAESGVILINGEEDESKENDSITDESLQSHLDGNKNGDV